MNPLIQSKTQLVLPILIALTLGCFGVAPVARAVTPPPDGGYPNQNTAEGEDALLNLDTHKGRSNTALGFHALTNARTAGDNTAVGANTLTALTNGGANTAVGVGALSSATHADSNTAVGASALLETTTGRFNTAIGYVALFSNTTGYENTGAGTNTLSNNSTGNNNTGYGYASLLNITTGNNNIGLGSLAGWRLKTGSNNIDIGAAGDPGDSNTIRIGEPETHQATYIAGISGATVADGVTVVVGAGGHLGTVVSSERFKDSIKPMADASAAILALKPVTFRYKKEWDPDGIPQFGLVAEQVEKVNPDLVARDEQGRPYTVRYEAVNAMLLNEFLKEHRKVEEQAATLTDLKSAVAQQQKDIAAFTAALKAQAAQIQKVSEQLRAQAQAPRVVAND